MEAVKAHLKFILTFSVPAPSTCLNYFVSSYRRKKRIFILYFPLVFTYEMCKYESKGSDSLFRLYNIDDIWALSFKKHYSLKISLI